MAALKRRERCAARAAASRAVTVVVAAFTAGR